MRRLAPFSLVCLIACGPSFYQAPPNIGEYPERLATKRWSQLFQETAPLDPVLPSDEALDQTCLDLPAKLRPLTTEQRISEIDRLLAENRNGPYQAARANFLHELRELASDAELFGKADAYLQWRLKKPAVLPPVPPRQRPWDMEPEAFAALQPAYDQALKEAVTAIEADMAADVPSLQPYWKVRLGAFLFSQTQYQEAAARFGEVKEQFPASLRAEAAWIMQARSLLEQSRVLQRDAMIKRLFHDPMVEKTLDDAQNLLNAYIELHPKGRFTPDAHGWLGAIAFDRNQFGLAAKYQLDRLTLQPTREITRTVLRECDFIFSRLLEVTNDRGWTNPVNNFDAAAIAPHPLVVRLFIQHALDPALGSPRAKFSDGEFYEERGTIRLLNDRIFKSKAFVRQALSELGTELLKDSAHQEPSSLLLLAWSSSLSGEHAQALALLNRIPEKDVTDESLYAKAIVLQRLDRHDEAVESFNMMKDRFGNSPLAAEVPYQLAMSFARSKEYGEALKELPVAPLEGGRGLSLRADDMLLQWADTLIQFAPLPQLEEALTHLDPQPVTNPAPTETDLIPVPEPAGKDRIPVASLRAAILARALAKHDFDLAHRHLSQEPSNGKQDYYSYRWAQLRPMDQEDWDERVAPLATLYEELGKATSSEETSRLNLAIARHWLANRGSLTLQVLNVLRYAKSEQEKQDILRRQNALQVGFSRETIDANLDRADEATHALVHALEAAKSTDPAIAAPALELANQCLFRRAEFSLYQRSRALETNATTLSSELHQQLQDRFPRSEEAIRSVRFTFQPPAGSWMPGDYNPSNAADALLKSLRGQKFTPWDWGNGNEQEAQVRAMMNLLANRFLAENPAPTLPALRRDLDAAREELRLLKRKITAADQESLVIIVNRLDDLAAAASLTDITLADFTQYANGRYDKLPPAFESLISFRKRLTIDSGTSQAQDDTIHGWQEFLQTYPDSPKAEAASFRLTRLIARKYRTRVKIEAFRFPDAPIYQGYKHIGIDREDPGTDPDTVIAAIREHEAKFPNTRYQDDLNLLRSGALIDAGKFAEALTLLESILLNPTQGDLHQLAALDFGDIAQRLLEPEQRHAVMNAFRNNPAALAHLKLLVEGDTFLSRLQPMMPFLLKQD